MIDLTVAQVADIVGGRLVDITPEEAASRRITGTVEFDSRAVTPGGLFVALPGARSDGHDFAVGAVRDGAVAVLAARPGCSGDRGSAGARRRRPVGCAGARHRWGGEPPFWVRWRSWPPPSPPNWRPVV